MNLSDRQAQASSHRLCRRSNSWKERIFGCVALSRSLLRLTRCERTSRLDFRTFAAPQDRGTRAPSGSRHPTRDLFRSLENVRSHRIQEPGTAGPLGGGHRHLAAGRIPIPGDSLQCEMSARPKAVAIRGGAASPICLASARRLPQNVLVTSDLSEPAAISGNLTRVRERCWSPNRFVMTPSASGRSSGSRVTCRKIASPTPGFCSADQRAKPPHGLRHPQPARKVGFRRLNLGSTSRAEGSQHDVEDRRKEQPEERHAEHPRKNGRSE